MELTCESQNNTTKASNNRLIYLDIARGISMLCIILGHLGNANINRVVFTFHVSIFYVISGFFISEKKEYGTYIKSRLKALIVPYYLTCIAIVVIGTVEGFILHGTVGAFDAMKEWVYASLYGAGDSYSSPFYIKAIGAIWFLWASFWGSILLKYSLRMKDWQRILFISLLFAVGYFSRKLFWFPLSIQAGCCATLFMYLGFCAKKTKSGWDVLDKEVKKALFICAALVWFFFIKDFRSFWLVHCDVGRGIVDIIGSLCACYVVFDICKRIDRVPILSKGLAYIGRYSIFMLCIHIIELNLFPWWQIAEKICCKLSMPSCLELLFVIIGKFLFDISLTVLASQNRIVKKLFGIK